MSVRAMAAVWDMELRRDHKLVLLAYADHADDDGGNIYPAVASIARKTGYSERSVQTITRQLAEIGALVLVGAGPKGTKAWRMDLTLAGAKTAPRSPLRQKAQPAAPGGAVATAPEPSLTINEPKDSRPNGRTDPIRRALEQHFSSQTRLPVPKTGTDRERKSAGALWWAPLRELLELGGGVDGAKRLITETVKKMRNDKLTISDPNSILKPARALAAELKPAEVPDYLVPPNQRA